jgi:hypothetical protein
MDLFDYFRKKLEPDPPWLLEIRQIVGEKISKKKDGAASAPVAPAPEPPGPT